MQRESATPGPWATSHGLADTSGLIDQIIDCAPVGMAVIDADGLYRRVNPAYCTLYGYTADDLIGSRFTRVFPPAQQPRRWPATRPFWWAGRRWTASSRCAAATGGP